MRRLLLIVLLVCFGVTVRPTAAEATSNTPTCAETEFVLKSFGYAVGVVGVCDARTTKAVVNFQQASGLVPDGLVGPITWAAMTAATERGRASPGTPAPSEPGAVSGLSGCAEMYAFMDLVGLPHSMDAIGRRESGCKNGVTSPTSCCGGWFQIHILNRNGPGYRAGFIRCGVDSKDDYTGDSYAQKLASVCVAKVLWDVWQAGGSANPWRL